MSESTPKVSAGESQRLQGEMENGAPEFGGLETGRGFQDNRPEAIAQRKKQAAITQSAQVQQLAQLQSKASASVPQQPALRPATGQGLPADLQAGMESLSGMDLGDVRVHRNSAKPAQLKAHAFAQGSDIHLATGQEQHLPHEAWHIVQQRQGRVRANAQAADGTALNTDAALEAEADVMGAKAAQLKSAAHQGRQDGAAEGAAEGGSAQLQAIATAQHAPVQRVDSDEEEEDKMEIVVKKEGDSENEKEIETKEDTESKQVVGEKREREEELENVKKVKRDYEESESKFWIRAVVRNENDSTTFKSSDITIKKVNISRERRRTKKEEKQGDHVVAWTAICSFWEGYLSGDLDAVAKKLQKLLINDQAADVLTSNDASRMEAYAIAQKIIDGDYTTSQYMNMLEVAISLFILTNQAGSFAINGNASGGNGEGKAMEYLGNCNANVTCKEYEEGKIWTSALKLIDLSKGFSNTVAKAKGIVTWYEMICSLFPNLVLVFDEYANKENGICGQSISDWDDAWKDFLTTNSFGETNEKIAEKKLQQGKTLLQPDDAMETTGVSVNMAPTDEKKGAQLTADEATIMRIEIPEKLRAKTKYGSTQGSHTIAWTFLRSSLEMQFNGCKVDVALKELKMMMDSDFKFANGSQYSEDDLLAERLSFATEEIDKYMDQKRSLSKWLSFVNFLILEYVEVNQLLSCTTFKSGVGALGHGEAELNKKFKKEDFSYEDLDDLLVEVGGYLDMGILFDELEPSFIEMLNPNPENIRTTRKNIKENEKSIKFPLPNKFAAQIFNEEKIVIFKKLFSDFTHHLSHFHPDLYQYLIDESTDCENFIESFVLCPLQNQKNTIYQRLKVHDLRKGTKNEFPFENYFKSFRIAIKETAHDEALKILKK